MCQIFIDTLKATGGNSNSSRTYKLKHTVQISQLLIQVSNIIAHTCHFDYRISWIYFYYMCSITTYDF